MSVIQPRKLSVSSSILHWHHWFVIGLALILTLGTWYAVSQQAKQKTELQFDYQSRLIVNLVRERMRKYEDALWAGVAALHAIDGEVTPNQWQMFSETLSLEAKYPGINGIGVIYYVPPNQLATYLAQQHIYRPDFSIYPAHSMGEYWPITYIEPVASNRQAVGLDMAHETNRYTAAKHARDTGLAQITGPIILVQDAEQTPGFLFFAPYYETNTVPKDIGLRQELFKGVVYAPFIMKKLMSGTLQNENRMVNFSIRDGEEVLYDELSNTSVDFDSEPLLTMTTSVDLYGRTWVFDIRSTTLFRDQHQNIMPLMILLGGVLLDIMLAIVFLALVGANKKANAFASLVTHDLRVNEVKLNTANSRLNCAFEAMLDGLFVISENGEVLEVNGKTLSLFGYERQELLSRNINCLIPILYSKEDASFLDKDGNNIVGQRHLMQGCRKDGSQFPIYLQVTEGREGNVRVYTGVIHDLTEKQLRNQKLAEKDAILGTAVHSSPAGFAIQGLDGCFVEANTALAEWLGYTPTEMVGMAVVNIIPVEDRVESADIVRQLLSGEAVSIRTEKQYRHKNGSKVWGLLSESVVKDDHQQAQYLVMQIIDIDAPKRLTLLLEERNVLLEQSNAELDQFAYVASHDLKAPLNAIDKLAGWIEEDCVDMLPESSKQHLTLLKSRIVRMAKLLDDLLLYSRAGRVSYELEQINVKALTSDIAMLFDLPDGFSCNVLTAVNILAPRVPFELVLRNLIGNAVKHHHKSQGLIEVSVEIDKQGFVLRVADDGPGIPEQLHERAVQMFQTLKPRDEVEGSGIGLALCKKVVEYYNGSLTIETNGDQGTVVVTRWSIMQFPVDRMK
jgi:PAS domain S-box-containing protein